MTRHLPDLADTLGSGPLIAASPISEIEVQPHGHRGILAAAEVAGVDPCMQNLLLHSAPGAQKDVMKTMLHRMAALEHRQRDAESSNAHARQVMSGGCSPSTRTSHYGSENSRPRWTQSLMSTLKSIICLLQLTVQSVLIPPARGFLRRVRSSVSVVH